MPAEVVMPRLSDTMTEGKVLKWRKHEGEPVKRGEIIAEIETDKAAMELESYDSGIVDKIIVPEGQTVPVGEKIATIKEPEAMPKTTAPVRESFGPPTEARAEARPPEEAAPPAPPAAPPKPQEERSKVSPLARRIAEERGLDLTNVVGTGPEGRITKEDVLGYIRQMEEAPPVTPVPPKAPPATQGQLPTDEAQLVEPTRMQATIAKRMSEAKATVPHYYVTTAIDMGEATRFLKGIETAEGELQIGYNDIILKASALALQRFPMVNAFYRDGRLQINRRINIGIAVSLQDGLVVPVVHDCDKKSLRQIASDARQAIERARAGKMVAGDYEGATFDVSNLGMFDVEEFAAIIDPPKSAILAVGTVREEPVVRDGQIVTSQRMKVTLSCDHRVFYGAEAARFLQEVKRLLENPLSLVV